MSLTQLDPLDGPEDLQSAAPEFPPENPDCIATNCLDDYEDVFGELLPDCSPGASEVCYDGPPGTDGVGQCTAGPRTCSSNGFFGACNGQVLPDTEICDDLIDNNCDGDADADAADSDCP